MYVYCRFWPHLRVQGYSHTLIVQGATFWHNLEKGAFLLFLNETLLTSFRSLHQSPELLLSLDLFIFSSFVHGSVCFSFFMSLITADGLTYPKPTDHDPSVWEAPRQIKNFRRRARGWSTDWPNMQFLTSINFHSTHSICHISRAILGTSHNLSWGGRRGNWGAFNFFWMEYGGP